MKTETEEMQDLLLEIKKDWGAVARLPGEFETFRETAERVQRDMADVRRAMVARPMRQTRTVGEISDDCARQAGAHFILHCERSGKLGAVSSSAADREALLRVSREILGLSQRAALTTGEVPLPAEFSGEIRELVTTFGVARRHMTHYPIGRGTARPARVGVRPAFGSIAMSVAFSEKSPAFEFASLESHKVGGIIRVPRELDEQSIVPLGRFLTRYAAVEFARAEDTWAFLADGSGTYESVKGVAQVASENAKKVQLAATKTKPSDATLDDFRLMRTLVNKAALNGKSGKYYLDTTWETRLAAFKTAAEPNVYQRLPDGSAILDGYPIVWTDVLQPYGTTAAANKVIAVFGALDYWWFGEHGSPRMDTSEHVYFANDQIAVRCFEEIDFDYMALDAASTLVTAAA